MKLYEGTRKEKGKQQSGMVVCVWGRIGGWVVGGGGWWGGGGGGQDTDGDQNRNWKITLCELKDATIIIMLFKQLFLG